MHRVTGRGKRPVLWRESHQIHGDVFCDFPPPVTIKHAKDAAFAVHLESCQMCVFLLEHEQHVEGTPPESAQSLHTPLHMFVMCICLSQHNHQSCKPPVVPVDLV